MLSKAFTLAALCSTSLAQSQEDKDAYPDYAAQFEKWNITWEPIKVHTEDGYTLTMFHVTGDDSGPFEITRPAVIMQHGMGGSGIGWASRLPTDKSNHPMAFQLAAMGFDIYLTNNSGVEYSQVHDVYTIDDNEFWMMDWSKFGTMDFPAAVREIQKRNGGKKVAMVGHSQGTTQTFAGMGLIPEWYDENVSVAALMGPCTIPNLTYFELYTEEVQDFLNDNDIYVIAGPNWEHDKELIMNSGIPALVEGIGSLEHLPNNPTQAIFAYAQAAMSGRFQRFTWDFFNMENPKTELMDFGLVKDMKIAQYIGLFDNTCPLTQAQAQYEQMGQDKTVVDFIVAPWQGHVPWGFSAAPWFINSLAENLMTNADL